MRIPLISTKKTDGRILAAPIELKLSSDKASAGTLSGYGSVFNVRDHHGDVVESGAFAASLAEHKAAGSAPAMLWSHDPDRPIGVWETVAEDARGLKLTGRLNLDTQDGREALALLKQGAFTGLSIGYSRAAGLRASAAARRRSGSASLLGSVGSGFGKAAKGIPTSDLIKPNKGKSTL